MNSELHYLEAKQTVVKDCLAQLPLLKDCPTMQEKSQRIGLNMQQQMIANTIKDLKVQGARSSTWEVSAILA
jgi:hypothetical protein